MDVDKMINYEKILNIKFNDDEYTISNAFNYDTIVWLSERNEKPTKELLDFKYNCLQDAELRYCYKQRIENYPSISDQLDMLWHAIESGALDKTSDFYLQLKEVKELYPKHNTEVQTSQGE
jgi:hypothetical protein